VRVVGIDGKGKGKHAALVDAYASALIADRNWRLMQLTLIGRDGELKVEHVRGVGEMRLHRIGQVELGKIWSVSMVGKGCSAK
jgi:hypothetical protein